MRSNLFVFTKPSRSDWFLVGTLWLVVLPFMIVGNTAKPWWLIGSNWLIDIGTHTGLVVVLVYWLFPTLLFTRRYLHLFLAVLVALFVFATLEELHVWWTYHSNKPWRWFTVLSSVVSMAPLVGVLTAVLAGKHFFETQQRLIKVEKERTEAELRHLKAQIDPHFLFNNLNVLAALIERNPQQASAYLHRFSALYRYLIRHKDNDVIALADELAFLDDYMYLVRQRFGRAYELVIILRVTDSLSALVLPGSLQTLVENAVKHNQASEDNPLLIELALTDERIRICNERRPKLTPVESTGTGLKNVQARYQLLSDQAVYIQPTASEFIVSLPMLHAAVLPSVTPLATRI